MDDLIKPGGAGRMQRQVDSERDHFIVCGLGKLGRHTAAVNWLTKTMRS